MSNSQGEFLSLFGWDEFFESHRSNFVSDSLIPARVINEERGLYRIQWDFEKVSLASVSGKMQFSASSRKDFPAVGDWVLTDVQSQSDRAIIHHVLPRKSVIYRKQVGSSVDVQILSANVDYVFITTSMNEDLNHRRLERYLAMVWDSGAIPVILLTKADLCEGESENIVNNAQVEFPGVDLYATSQNDFEEAKFLIKYLKNGKTSIFIGSSGVGKSTLVNFLISDEKVKTQDIRESDGKGRHTTTSRSLYVSRYGGLIIDTPGMRELQLSDHASGVQTQFSDVEELIESCRFTDCKHITEPGCAIKQALLDGLLSEERWKSYQKLEAEVRYGLRKQDKALAAEEKKIWKKRSIEGWEKGKEKRRR